MIKVADFGVSENIDINKNYFRQNKEDTIKLPIKWLPIESINDGVFSEKTDVVGTLKCTHTCMHISTCTFIIVGLWCDMLGGV